MSYLKLAVSQFILRVLRGTSQTDFWREHLASSKGALLRTIVDFREFTASGLLDSNWGHLPQGYLFARPKLSLLPKFSTGDLTAID